MIAENVQEPTDTLLHVQATLRLLRTTLAVLPFRLLREHRCQEYAILRMRECEDYLRQWIELRTLDQGEDLQGRVGK